MKGGFFVTKITELLDDFKLNQQVQGKRAKYIEMCIWRLSRWKDFMQEELSVEEIEEVRPIHIKRYIQYRQQLGQDTININIATLKVFFNSLVEEEFIEELSNPMRRNKSLIVTFNDYEVKQIITDVEEEIYSIVRDKLIL